MTAVENRTSTADSLAPNLRRDWVHNSSSDRRAGRVEGEFVVLTYNILNQDLCSEGLYPYCPDNLLSPAQRHPLLMKEIDHHGDVDIICMQEVDCHYYEKTLEPAMQTRDFVGLFVKRPVDRSPGDSRPWTDGSATFYREARFQLVKQQDGLFRDLFEKEKEGRHQELDEAVVTTTLIDSRRAYLFTLLRCRQTDKLVAVGNVHLTCMFGNFKRMDLVALEAAFVTNGLVHFCGGMNVPHILCGDFNFEPHHPGYQLLHDGKLNEAMAVYLQNLNGDNNGKDNKRVTSLINVFQDCFKHDSASLKSAYKTVVGHEVPFSCYEDSRGLCRTPEGDITCKAVQALYDTSLNHSKNFGTDSGTWETRKFVAAMDYIWFSSDSLHCEGVLKMVEEELILPFHACPNAAFPSDHLPVKAKFSFREV